MDKFPEEFCFSEKTIQQNLQEIRKTIFDDFTNAINKKSDYIVVSIINEPNIIKQIITEIFERFEFIGFPSSKPDIITFDQSIQDFIVNTKFSDSASLKNIVRYQCFDKHGEFFCSPTCIFTDHELPSYFEKFVIPLTQKFINNMEKYYIWI